MKNLFFIMMAILLINVSYGASVGEDMGSDCGDQVQKSRFAGSQEVAATSTEKPVRTEAPSSTTVR